MKNLLRYVLAAFVVLVTASVTQSTRYDRRESGNTHFKGITNLENLYIDDVSAVNVTAAELLYLDGITAGQTLNSKAWIMDASGVTDVASGDELNIDGTLSIAGTNVGASATEIDYNDITTLGTVEASKAWTASAGTKTILATGGEFEIQSGGELDVQSGATLILQGLTLTAAEVGIIDGITVLGESYPSKALTMSAGDGTNGTATIGTTDTLDVVGVLELGGVPVTFASYTTDGGDGLDTLSNAAFDASTLVAGSYLGTGGARYVTFDNTTTAGKLYVALWDTSGTNPAEDFTYTAWIQE